MSSNPEKVQDQLLGLIEKECCDHGFALRPVKWYAEELGCTRLEVKNGLETLANARKIRRSTHYDEDGVRRMRIVLRRK